MVKKYFLLLLVAMSLQAQSLDRATADSLYHQLAAANPQAAGVDMGSLARYARGLDSDYQHKILQLYLAKAADSRNNKNGAMWANSNLAAASLYVVLGKRDSALQLCLNCAEKLQQSGETALEAGCYSFIIKNSLGSERETLKYIYDALYLYEQLHDTAQMVPLYAELARACRRSGNLKRAVYYSLKTVGPACDDSLYSLSLAAYYYLHLGDTTDGQRLITIARRKHSCASDTMNFFYYRAMCYYFRLKGQIDSSNYYAMNVVQPLIINGLYRADPEPVLILAANCQERGLIKEQKKWIDLVYNSASDHSAPYFLQQIYEAKYRWEEQQGNEGTAYKFYKQYVFWTDSIKRMGVLDEVVTREADDEFRNRKEAYESASTQQISRQKNITILSLVFLLVVFVFGVFQYRNYKAQQKANLSLAVEKKRSEDLLLNILPEAVAEELKAKGSADARLFDEVTVLFTDFKSFTSVSETLTPQILVNELNECFRAFDEIVGKYNIEKIKTMGDGFIAAAGLPSANPNHAIDMVKAALEIRDFMAERQRQTKDDKLQTFEIRIGLHSGPVVAGIVGVKKFAYDIWGDTVNTAARMEQNSEAGKVNISEATYAFVKDQFKCEYRGEIEVKNKGKMKMYFVGA